MYHFSIDLRNCIYRMCSAYGKDSSITQQNESIDKSPESSLISTGKPDQEMCG